MITITDQKGNSHHCTGAQERLYRAGWRLMDVRKRGMFKTCWWYRAGETGKPCVNQTTALLMLKEKSEEA